MTSVKFQKNIKFYLDDETTNYIDTFYIIFICLDCDTKLGTFLDYSACPNCGSGYFIDVNELNDISYDDPRTIK